MKKAQLIQLIKEALTDKVKAVSVPASKLQKGDTMAADKAKITSVKKDGDKVEVTLSSGKKLNFKKDKQVQIVRAGSTLEKKYTNENYEEADDEFDTGGYVEAMGPELDKHIKAIAGIFQEWENGPATEPEMVGYAMYDLIEYIKRAIRR